MGIPGSTSLFFAGASGAAGGGYEIEKSLRFNPGDDAHFTRSPGSAGDQQTFTFSFWIKQCDLSSNTNYIYTAGAGTPGGLNNLAIGFNTYNQLFVEEYGATINDYYFEKTEARYRDPSAWYSFLIKVDITQVTATDRIKFFCNGVEQTKPATSYPFTENTPVNSTALQTIGSDGLSDLSAYLAEFYLIDGQALTASDFGEEDEDTGQWIPKEYTGTYGPLLDQSQTWSSLVSTADSLRSGGGAFAYGALSTIFDGNLANGVGTSSGDLTLSFSSGISTSNSTVEVYIYHSYSATITAGGNTYTTNTGASYNNEWVSVSGVSGTITQITVNGSGSVGTCGGIKIDGNILVDSGVTLSNNGFYLKFNGTDLGEDSSGNNNDWTATNLTQSVAGTTSVESGSYVGNLAYTNTATDYSDMDAQKLKGFDADTATWWNISTGGGTTTATWTPSSAVDTSDGGFRCWQYGSWHIGGTGYEIQFNINGTGWYTVGSLSNASGHADAVPQWWTVTVPNNSLTSFATKTISGNAGWGTGAWGALEVNGEVLQENGDENTVDVSTDTPTNYGDEDTGVGGEVRGNYCSMNPLDNGGLTLSNGNLQCAYSTAGWIGGRGTMGMSSGKWFWEVTLSVGSGLLFGISKNDTPLDSYLGYYATGWGYNSGDGGFYGSGSGGSGSTYTTNDVIGVAFDADNGVMWFAKNGTWQNSATKSEIEAGTTTNAAHTGLTSGPYFPAAHLEGSYGTTVNINFGARPFAYTAPSGFKCLCTQNLPDPTIEDPSKHFETLTYDGDGSASERTITGLDFEPDLIWLKRRSSGTGGYHLLWDAVRGGSLNISTNETAPEYNLSNWGYGAITGSATDGIKVTTGSIDDYHVNDASSTYVAWAWNAGTANTSASAGSIDGTNPTIASTYRANPSAGFSIVSYTGNNTNGATIGHGLNVVPEFAVFKDRDSTKGWVIYHKDIAPKVLDFTASAAFTSQEQFSQTAPTSSVFTLGSNGRTNQSGNNLIAYCWSEVSGYSSFGKYLGNNSADGAFVWCGFRPAYILTKGIDDPEDWYIRDVTRSPENVVDNPLRQDTGSEYSGRSIDILSNGFKIRDADNQINDNGKSYLYCAFAEHPFKYARAR